MIMIIAQKAVPLQWENSEGVLVIAVEAATAVGIKKWWLLSSHHLLYIVLVQVPIAF